MHQATPMSAGGATCFPLCMRLSVLPQEWVVIQMRKEVRLKELEAKAAALEQGQEVGCNRWEDCAEMGQETAGVQNCCAARPAEQRASMPG